MKHLLISLVVALAVYVAVGAEIDIGAGTIDLPAGWVVLEDKRECFTGEDGIQNGFRNAEGTVWIVSSVVSPTTMEAINLTTSQWLVIDRGEFSGYDYIVLAKPGHEAAPFIVFPKLRTYFSIGLTENGFMDSEEALRWWTPPQGDEFHRMFDEVRKILFSAYRPVALSTE